MSKKSPIIGILALQGDYQKHTQILDKINVSSVEVHRAEDFERIDRLIIPGGESTVMLKLMKRLGLEDAFTEFIKNKPVWGTCAGMVLLASQVNNHSQQTYDAIDIVVDRNGYGRQYFSSVEPSLFEMNGFCEKINLVFIRAPRVINVGKGVRTLISWNNDPVFLSQNNILVSSFHPELTGSSFLHDYFAHNFQSDAYK
ncbi:MAG: pyridoxal 5'-phosphate synthase glutaminase subunit PdxT [candidate division Zixibacteria bacterium]|nr:pyridoxal 5'-phosphate synthase glutaminase subunit PdxT [candidate division Zixibacteria bacterium]